MSARPVEARAGGLNLTKPAACTMVAVEPLTGIPEISPGDDLAAGIAAAATGAGFEIGPGDVLVVSQKIVSKAEGKLVRMADVTPSQDSVELAASLDRDPRHIEVVLQESRRIVRAERVLICETHSGLVCANAGVDRSNVPGDDTLVLLPEDPDRSARKLRADLAERLGTTPAVVVADTFGRPWRVGQTDVAIGCAGLLPLEDLSGTLDAHGRMLDATAVAVADEAAAAADLARTKSGQTPVVAVRGLARHITRDDGPGARALQRSRDEDLFR